MSLLFTLRPEDRVMVNNSKYERGNKLEPRWQTCLYQVEKQPFPQSPVYDIVIEGQGNVQKHLHKNLLQPCVFRGDSPTRPAPDWEDGGTMNIPLIQKVPLV